jgi:hypothetical protein
MSGRLEKRYLKPKVKRTTLLEDEVKELKAEDSLTNKEISTALRKLNNKQARSSLARILVARADHPIDKTSLFLGLSPEEYIEFSQLLEEEKE